MTTNFISSINIVSRGALSKNAFSSSYSSSTAALFNFTEIFSQELMFSKATDVRPIAVSPFYIDGEIYTTLRKYMNEKALRMNLELFGETPHSILCRIKAGCNLILYRHFNNI